MGLKERLLVFIEFKGLEKASFEKLVGLSNGFVDKSGDNTRYSSLDKISNSFPDLNISWLRTGEGEMIKTGDIKVFGDNNISNTGITGGNVTIDGSSDVSKLKKRIKELEEEINQLKKDNHEEVKQLNHAVDRLIDTNSSLMAVNTKLTDVIVEYITNKDSESNIA